MTGPSLDPERLRTALTPESIFDFSSPLIRILEQPAVDWMAARTIEHLGLVVECANFMEAYGNMDPEREGAEAMANSPFFTSKPPAEQDELDKARDLALTAVFWAHAKEKKDFSEIAEMAQALHDELMAAKDRSETARSAFREGGPTALRAFLDAERRASDESTPDAPSV